MKDHVLALLRKYLPGPFRPSGGSNVLTRCPFHKGGEEKKPSFSVNLEKALYHCFTCHEAGDIKRLLRMVGVARSTIDSELAAIKPLLDKNRELQKIEKLNVFGDMDPFKADYILPEVILGVYEWMPMKLIEDGFNPILLQDMEIGFDRNNLRITYPLRDMYGNLAGFSGGATEPEQWPKYKVYQGKRKGLEGQWYNGDYGDWFDEQFPEYKCENHDFLWNYDRVYTRLVEMSDPSDTVYVVEGFKACLWMIQNGYPNTVALMGSYISDRQQQMLHRLGGNLVLCLDNDEAGRKGTVRVGELLWKPMYGRIKVMSYPEGDIQTQPDDYEPDALHQMIGSSISLTEYLNRSFGNTNQEVQYGNVAVQAGSEFGNQQEEFRK